MKRAMLLASCIIISAYAADTENKKNVAKYKIQSFVNIPEALTMALGENHDYNLTAVGIDFDQTLAHKEADLPYGKKANLLLNTELYMADSTNYTTANEAKKELGLDEDANLLTAAIDQAGYAKFLSVLKENDDESTSSHSLAKKIKEKAPYVYTENSRTIKAEIKKLQFAGAFVAICSLGSRSKERKHMATGVGIHEENWAAGEQKFEKLMEIAQKNLNHKKEADKDNYDTVILIDNAQSGVDNFIKKASEDPSIKNIVGIKYDDSVTKEEIVNEFNDIAGKSNAHPLFNFIGY